AARHRRAAGDLGERLSRGRRLAPADHPGHHHRPRRFTRRHRQMGLAPRAQGGVNPRQPRAPSAWGGGFRTSQGYPMTAPDTVRITRALISVSDKTGLVTLGQALAARGVEILSTGGSAQRLAEAGVPVKEVSEHTGFPE